MSPHALCRQLSAASLPDGGAAKDAEENEERRGWRGMTGCLCKRNDSCITHTKKKKKKQRKKQQQQISIHV
jgi:hypothetical protein